MFVDTKDCNILGKHGLHFAEAVGTDVAPAGVVVATLGIVVVGDDGGAKSGLRQDIETGQPGQLGTDFVDLVNRSSVGAERESGGR